MILRLTRSHALQLPAQIALVLSLPLLAYIVTCWLVRPLTLGANISLSSLLPGTFLLGFLLLKTTRTQFLAALRELNVEFILLATMALLTVFSLLNTSEPFRAFRVFFPCVLPFLLFFQLLAFWAVAPRQLLSVPRIFMIVGLVFTATFLVLSMLIGPGYFFGVHRFIGGFENANQHSVVLAVLIPLVIGEVSVSRSRKIRIGWIFVLFGLLYMLVRTGSKTALLLGLAAGLLFFFLANVRSYTPIQRFLFLFGMVGLAAGILVFGLKIAEAIDPILAEKLRLIFSGGVQNYYSIQSRQELWAESIRLGSQHWLIGSGAGQKVLGVSHSHNLALDYFRGIGLFGAIAVVLLCFRILWRCAAKTLSVLSGADSIADRRIWACYTAASLYVVCNQLSDSFGPTTIAALWIIYLPAVIYERLGDQNTVPTSVRDPQPVGLPQPST